MNVTLSMDSPSPEEATYLKSLSSRVTDIANRAMSDFSIFGTVVISDGNESLTVSMSEGGQ